MTVSMLGWLATAVFTISYFFSDSATLKKIQAAAACLWLAYGIAIGAAPVVVANLIVAGAALLSSLRRRPAQPNPSPAQIQIPAMPATPPSIAEEINAENA